MRIPNEKITHFPDELHQLFVVSVSVKSSDHRFVSPYRERITLWLMILYVNE